MGSSSRRLVALVAAAVLLAACASMPQPTPSAVPTSAPATASPPASVEPTDPLATATAQPTAESTPTASATDVLTPTPTADLGMLQLPSVTCCRGQELEPGRYGMPAWFAIPLSLDVPDGWRVLNEERARLFMLGRGENVQDNPSQIVLFLDATGATPDALIEAIANLEELTVAAAPSAVSVAGFDGAQVDVTALPNPDFEGSPEADIPPGVQYLPFIARYFAAGFDWTTSTPEAELRTVALTIGDQTLMVYLEAPPEELDELGADVAPILESLELPAL